MAGYSGTPLVNKLGIKPGHGVALVNAPPDFTATLGDLPEDLTLRTEARSPALFDVILLFTRSAADLKKRFSPLAARLTPAGGLWIAWPKKASGVVTDLTEDAIRRIGLNVGLVDNKVCAVDDIWSGLRFVIRLQDRPKKSRPKST
jgi:hypothetical protein